MTARPLFCLSTSILRTGAVTARPHLPPLSAERRAPWTRPGGVGRVVQSTVQTAGGWLPVGQAQWVRAAGDVQLWDCMRLVCQGGPSRWL